MLPPLQMYFKKILNKHPYNGYTQLSTNEQKKKILGKCFHEPIMREQLNYLPKLILNLISPAI